MGRKRLNKKQICYRIEQVTLDKLNKLAEIHSVTQGKIIESAIENFHLLTSVRPTTTDERLERMEMILNEILSLLKE